MNHDARVKPRLGSTDTNRVYLPAILSLRRHQTKTLISYTSSPEGGKTDSIRYGINGAFSPALLPPANAKY